MTAHFNPRGDVAVLVVAAGSGVRLGPGAPKALRLLAGEPLVRHALLAVRAAPSVGYVVVAAPPSDVDAMIALADPGTAVVAGGAHRQESVAYALAAVPDEFDIVLVHDAARALAPPSLVEDVAAAVRAGAEAVIPVLPVVDTVKAVDAQGRVVGTVDRSVLRIVQTPQGFRRTLLVTAHAAAVDAMTDDAGLVEKLGGTVHTVPGSEYAFKITTPADLTRAEALLRAGW